MRKVNMTVIRPWVAKKIVDLIGFEDEVVIEYAMGLLEDDQNPVSFIASKLSFHQSLIVVVPSRFLTQEKCKLP